MCRSSFGFLLPLARFWCWRRLCRGPVGERTVRALAVVLHPIVIQRAPNIIQSPEPAHIQALIAQSSVEALYVAVLHRPTWLDMHQIDFALLCPGQYAPRSEL